MNTKYTKEEVISMYESDEPIFILRGQDIIAPDIIAQYVIRLMIDGKHTDASKVAQAEKQMRNWQRNNKGKVKTPSI